ncbi:uncharacterized protein YjbJ (UPF0337 family) [Bosea sp. OAE752]
MISSTRACGYSIVIAGKRDQLEGKIQERYGIEKDKVKTDVDTWYNRQTW